MDEFVAWLCRPVGGRKDMRRAKQIAQQAKTLVDLVGGAANIHQSITTIEEE